MEYCLTVNLAGPPREQLLLGRTHLVAPCTMIVPGVLNGNRGPFLYTLEECKRNPWAWNGMPIVLGHPVNANGDPISARQSDVLNERGLGIVLGAHAVDKLGAESWFDIQNCDKHAPGLTSKIRRQEPIELSTGLGFTINKIPGEYEGVKYDGIAMNFDPDHLAVLMDAVGACSLEDGCGIGVNETKPAWWKKWFSWVWNELSHDDVRMALQLQLTNRFGENAWIVDGGVFDDRVVYHADDSMYQLPFTKAGDVVTLTDETPVEVRRQTTFVITNEDNSMTRDELVADIVGNCQCMKAEDLANVPDNVLQVLHERQPVPAAPAPAANSETVTRQDLIEAVTAAVTSAVTANNESQERAALIQQITSNENHGYPEGALDNMPLAALRVTARHVAPLTQLPPHLNFVGAASPHGVINEDLDQDPLETQEMEFTS